MDGRGQFLANVFVEWFYRNFKYECVFLHASESRSQTKAGVGKWMELYNSTRPHSALGGTSHVVVYR